MNIVSESCSQDSYSFTFPSEYPVMWLYFLHFLLGVLSWLPLSVHTNGAALNILFKADDPFIGEKNLKWKTGTAFSYQTGQSWTHLRNSHTEFTFKTFIMKLDLS